MDKWTPIEKIAFTFYPLLIFLPFNLKKMSVILQIFFWFVPVLTQNTLAISVEAT